MRLRRVGATGYNGPWVDMVPRGSLIVRYMSDHAVLHVKGRILVGAEDVRDELWVVDGRVSYDRPLGAQDVRTVEGWALPGLVDAHCHVGLGPHGPVPEDIAEKQALTDREAGTLLIRDAGPPPTPAGSTTATTSRRSSGPPPHRPHPPLHPELRP